MNSYRIQLGIQSSALFLPVLKKSTLEEVLVAGEGKVIHGYKYLILLNFTNVNVYQCVPPEVASEGSIAATTRCIGIR